MGNWQWGTGCKKGWAKFDIGVSVSMWGVIEHGKDEAGAGAVTGVTALCVSACSSVCYKPVEVGGVRR